MWLWTPPGARSFGPDDPQGFVDRIGLTSPSLAARVRATAQIVSPVRGPPRPNHVLEVAWARVGPGRRRCGYHR